MKGNSKKLRFLFIFGTRPEAIKLAPVIRELRKISDVSVCVTGQHREMLDQVLQFFSIVPDYDLNVMTKNQSLFNLTANLLMLLEGVIETNRPDMIIVQGDTTSAFTGALAGFYSKTKVAHIEAGLRSFDRFSPFPEEINRVLVGHIAEYHFAPTPKAKANLLKEGIAGEKIFVVGNTVIDALFTGLDIVRRDEARFSDYFEFIDFSRKVILVTVHRRESFGKSFEDICYALKEIAMDEVEIVYPVHLNPNVRGYVYPILGGMQNIHLIEPLEYPYLIWLMAKSYMVLTDSGGIQEEAPSLGKPVLVVRDVTERTEGIDAGTAILIGTDREKIISTARLLLADKVKYNEMAKKKNPYGDGKAAIRIKEAIKSWLTD